MDGRIRSTLLAAVTVALTTGATAEARTMEAKCGSRTGSYLFWPKGHDARPGAGFPAFPTPHLEVYDGQRTTKFPDGAQDAYLDATGGAGAARSCRTSAASFSAKAVARGRTVKAESNVLCNFKTVVSYRIGKAGGGTRLQTIRRGAVVVDVRLSASGSSLRFDKRYCRSHATPS